jgi:hypothetical protein
MLLRPRAIEKRDGCMKNGMNELLPPKDVANKSLDVGFYWVKLMRLLAKAQFGI